MKAIEILQEAKQSTPTTNPVAKNANKAIGGGASGAHKNPKRAESIPRKEKHKKSLDVAEAKRPDRPLPKTDLQVGDRVVADLRKEKDYPGGHQFRSGFVTRIGEKGVHIEPDDRGPHEWHPYKIVKKLGEGKSAREKWIAASNAREKAHNEREAAQAKLPPDKRSGAAIDALEKHVKGVAEGIKEIDMTGKKCTACKKGTYQETSMHDDMDGVLHCTNCNKEITRWQAGNPWANVIHTTDRSAEKAQRELKHKQAVANSAKVLKNHAKALDPAEIDLLTRYNLHHRGKPNVRFGRLDNEKAEKLIQNVLRFNKQGVAEGNLEEMNRRGFLKAAGVGLASAATGGLLYSVANKGAEDDKKFRHYVTDPKDIKHYEELQSNYNMYMGLSTSNKSYLIMSTQAAAELDNFVKEMQKKYKFSLKTVKEQGVAEAGLGMWGGGDDNKKSKAVSDYETAHNKQKQAAERARAEERDRAWWKAQSDAAKAGKDSFEFDGKTHPLREQDVEEGSVRSQIGDIELLDYYITDDTGRIIAGPFFSRSEGHVAYEKLLHQRQDIHFWQGRALIVKLADMNEQSIIRDTNVSSLDEHGKASRELCVSSKPDSQLGASNLASCKSQGLRARDGKKSHKLGKSPASRVTVGGHKIKGNKYGGPLPDWS